MTFRYIRGSVLLGDVFPSNQSNQVVPFGKKWIVYETVYYTSRYPTSLQGETQTNASYAIPSQDFPGFTDNYYPAFAEVVETYSNTDYSHNGLYFLYGVGAKGSYSYSNSTKAYETIISSVPTMPILLGGDVLRTTSVSLLNDSDFLKYSYLIDEIDQ